MSYKVSEYAGDDEYQINTTGDAVVGDEVRFEQSKFTGSYRKPKFAGFELITGKIINDSYGKEKQQHTFTLELNDGSILKIRGRNLYKNGLFRKKWENEDARELVADEKHERGAKARMDRQNRINGISLDSNKHYHNQQSFPKIKPKLKEKENDFER